MTVVRVFNQRVEASKRAGGWDWSVERVLEVIVCKLLACVSVLSVCVRGPGGKRLAGGGGGGGISWRLVARRRDVVICIKQAGRCVQRGEDIL